MAKSCELCGKTKWVGFALSHSHRRTKREWRPNLKRKKVLLNGVTPTHMQVCTSCIRSQKTLNARSA